MVREMSGRGKILVGKCPVGEVSFGEVSCRGIVHSGKCLSGKCASGKCQSGNCPWGSVSRGTVQSGNSPHTFTLYSAYCAWFFTLLASPYAVLLCTCPYLFLAQFDSSVYIRIQFELH